MAGVCAKCNEPLTITIEASDDDSDVEMDGQEADGPEIVPDDVRLSCGDRFHWQCLVDSYEVSKCPHCDKDISTDSPQTTTASGSSSSSAASAAAAAARSQQSQDTRIIVDMHNEGGVQEGIDIYPLLREETYLRAYPEEAPARAFISLCGEGDHRAVTDLLKMAAEPPDDEGPSMSPDEILRYRDPLNLHSTGLHAAAANGQREVAWLLLLLASNLPELEFPALVYQEASALGIYRSEQEGKVDIRTFKDDLGRTAEQVAVSEGGVVWNGWIGNNRLSLRD